MFACKVCFKQFVWKVYPFLLLNIVNILKNYLKVPYNPTITHDGACPKSTLPSLFTMLCETGFPVRTADIWDLRIYLVKKSKEQNGAESDKSLLKFNYTSLWNCRKLKSKRRTYSILEKGGKVIFKNRN